MMRIALLCGSLENGRNGVGDYTRRLAAECIRQGHEARIVALAEKSPALLETSNETVQSEGDVEVPCMHLGARLPWNVRSATARTWLKSFGADSACLQFVPYAYSGKGLPFRLSFDSGLRCIAGEWAIMFHELNLGLNQNAKLKERLIGLVQRKLIVRLNTTLRPQVVFTQCQLYQNVLRSWGIDAKLLPLFGNISVTNRSEAGDVLTEISTNREGCLVVGVFGNIESRELIADVTIFLNAVAERMGRELILVQFGNLSPDSLARLRAASSEVQRARLIEIGPVQDRTASQLMHALDFGIVNTSRARAEKSGSLAAFLDHDVPCIVSDCGWRSKIRYVEENTSAESRMIRVGDFDSIAAMLTKPRFPRERISEITSRFIGELETREPSGFSLEIAT